MPSLQFPSSKSAYHITKAFRCLEMAMLNGDAFPLFNHHRDTTILIGIQLLKLTVVIPLSTVKAPVI